MPTGTMLRYAIELTVFICGAVLMALEIIGGRLLAPYYGSTVYVWGSIIGIAPDLDRFLSTAASPSLNNTYPVYTDALTPVYWCQIAYHSSFSRIRT